MAMTMALAQAGLSGAQAALAMALAQAGAALAIALAQAVAVHADIQSSCGNTPRRLSDTWKQPLRQPRNASIHRGSSSRLQEGRRQLRLSQHCYGMATCTVTNTNTKTRARTAPKASRVVVDTTN